MEFSISDAQLNWLRFPAEVETRFHQHYFTQSILISRVALALRLLIFE
jgi:hypothetical protein